MIYKVVKDFADLQDNEHVYFAGDTFPRKGADVSEERIAELSSVFNKRGEVLIEPVKEKKSEVIPQAASEPNILPKAEENEPIKETAKRGRKTAKKEEIEEK